MWTRLIHNVHSRPHPDRRPHNRDAPRRCDDAVVLIGDGPAVLRLAVEQPLPFLKTVAARAQVTEARGA